MGSAPSTFVSVTAAMTVEIQKMSATSALQAIGTSLLIVVCGALFYFMVKAMARIQMPTRDPR